MRIYLILCGLAFADVSAPDGNSGRGSSNLVVFAGAAYWSDYDANENRSRILISVSDVYDPEVGWSRPIASQLHSPCHLVAAGGRVFWSTHDWRIQSVDYQGHPVRTETRTHDQFVELVADGGILCWLDQDVLRHIDIRHPAAADTLSPGAP